MAIKGRTKRSQARPVRRPAAAPRIVPVERKPPWYTAPAFLVTLAVVALLATLLVGWYQVQRSWQRDDVARFTAELQGPMSQLEQIAGAGYAGKPGMGTAASLAGSKSSRQLAADAATWQAQIGKVSDAVSAIQLGTPVFSSGSGLPNNDLGSRVPSLSAVRAMYVDAVTLYEQAAGMFAQAGAERPGSGAATTLATQAQTIQTQAQQTLDDAAAALVWARHAYGLSVHQQAPGESTTSYQQRTSTTGGVG